MVKLSIITVCYNAEKTIKRTIESILNQSYKNFEWVVVDGKSKDKTMDIINGYLSKFKDDGINVTLVSEKDNGAYDAMNKGSLLAKGEYLTYMNADDTYYDNFAIEKFAKKANESTADIIYGNTMFVKSGGVF